MIGGGLAGCEAAWALAERGLRVTLHEMRPVKMTPAHQTESLAELVCSNTFKSVEPTHAHGLLKAEMRLLGGGSIVLQAADEARIPGGSALAVDRIAFAAGVEARVLGHPNITLVRGEVGDLPSPGIVATGPLTSDALAGAIASQQQLLPRPVPNGHREHAVQPVQSFSAVLLVKVNDGFGVRSRPKDMASADQVVTKLLKVINLAVKYYPYRIILVRDRLSAREQIDY